MSEAEHILRASASLMTVFLLQNARREGSGLFNADRIARFLLWFAFEGRHEHQSVAFTPEYLQFLSEPVEPYPSRLAAFVAKSRAAGAPPASPEPAALAAWYYCEIVPKHRLWPLVSVRERRALLRSPLAHAAQTPPILVQGLAHSQWHVPGINLVGFTEGVFGIGEDARTLAQVIIEAGVPLAINMVGLPETVGTSEPSQLAPLFVDRPIFPINLFAMTAFETARLRFERGAGLFADRYNIGFWPWELTSFPEYWRSVFDLVDEIWVPSDFLVDVYSHMTQKPVIVMPPPVLTPEAELIDAAEFGLAVDDFVFLTMFDFNSQMARKNPLGAIEAFQAAFPDPSGPERLVIKTINSHAQPAALAALETRMGEDDRIILIDGPLGRAEVCGLIAAADCFVSLHRAEGFGRAIAEAMLLGTPVVATDWSGNTSFVSEETGFPVGYSLSPVSSEDYPFGSGSVWAEPRLESAVAQLRAVRANGAGVQARSEAGRAAIAERYSGARAGERIVSRLQGIARVDLAGAGRRVEGMAPAETIKPGALENQPPPSRLPHARHRSGG